MSNQVKQIAQPCSTMEMQQFKSLSASQPQYEWRAKANSGYWPDIPLNAARIKIGRHDGVYQVAALVPKDSNWGFPMCDIRTKVGPWTKLSELDSKNAESFIKKHNISTAKQSVSQSEQAVLQAQKQSKAGVESVQKNSLENQWYFRRGLRWSRTT